MAIYERESLVQAPLDDVWAFYSKIDALVTLTPDWFGLRVEGVTGPDGAADPPALLEGTAIDLSVRPLGVGPRQRTTSRIEERRGHDDVALLRDRMIEGPFEDWVHTHVFESVDGGTLVRDRVEYRLPGGVAGRLAARAMVVGLAPTFRYRHRRTRALLED